MLTSRLFLSLAAHQRSTTSLTHRFPFVSWNIDAFSQRPVARANVLLNHILDGPHPPPDIIFLQEVRATVRAGWLVKGAEDLTAWDGVPFATITLLSKARFASSDLDSQKELEGEGKFMLGPTTRVPLPSKYGRDGLSVDIIPPSPSTTPGTGTHFRLINVHLDSLWHTFPNRAQQLKILASLLREPGCAGGVIAGDFNAISPADDGLVEENGLVDAWVALHGHGQGQGHGHGKDGEGDGATWGVGVERERHDGLGPGRLDKVAMTMNGVKAEEMEVLRPGNIEVPRPGEESVHVPWSDHCGLRYACSDWNLLFDPRGP
ncbi:hypothetical protein BD410DRAFT_823219 [Rickenella mellea]|uniref:Endonuclease/exonuclease/phosphatase domain-containing protein n=1 Tax=Rickenella mellea TaxID=50990 RepID=A0A4Y7PGH8_9AGAM|nr:hypothetical protein BD410DRAFT_823219 [Rickenella mellea]